VEFLGYVISRNDIRMNPRKVQTIVDWAIPTSVGMFNVFLDISNFIIGTMLSQLGEDNLLHHVSFRFLKFSSMEINYKIHD